MPISLRGEIGATRLDSAFQQMSQRVVDRITALQRFGATLDQKKQQLGIILEAMVEGVIAIDDQQPVCELLTNRRCFDLIDAPKQLTEITGGHFGLAYRDTEPYRQTMGATIKFLHSVFGS